MKKRYMSNLIMFIPQFFVMVGKIEIYISQQQFISTLKRVESFVRRFSTQIFHPELISSSFFESSLPKYGKTHRNILHMCKTKHFCCVGFIFIIEDAYTPCWQELANFIDYKSIFRYKQFHGYNNHIKLNILSFTELLMMLLQYIVLIMNYESHYSY